MRCKSGCILSKRYETGHWRHVSLEDGNSERPVTRTSLDQGTSQWRCRIIRTDRQHDTMQQVTPVAWTTASAIINGIIYNCCLWCRLWWYLQ